MLLLLLLNNKRVLTFDFDFMVRNDIVQLVLVEALHKLTNEITKQLYFFLIRL